MIKVANHRLVTRYFRGGKVLFHYSDYMTQSQVIALARPLLDKLKAEGRSNYEPRGKI